MDPNVASDRAVWPRPAPPPPDDDSCAPWGCPWWWLVIVIGGLAILLVIAIIVALRHRAREDKSTQPMPAPYTYNTKPPVSSRPPPLTPAPVPRRVNRLSEERAPGVLGSPKMRAHTQPAVTHPPPPTRLSSSLQSQQRPTPYRPATPPRISPLHAFDGVALQETWIGRRVRIGPKRQVRPWIESYESLPEWCDIYERHCEAEGWVIKVDASDGTAAVRFEDDSIIWYPVILFQQSGKAPSPATEGPSSPYRRRIPYGGDEEGLMREPSYSPREEPLSPQASPAEGFIEAS